MFADAGGAPAGWRLLSAGAVVGRGDAVAELPEARPWVRIVLAVPGTDVTLHWIELAEGLTPVQAAAAARLQLAEDTPDPLGALHVAAGRTENGRTAVALVPAVRMDEWIAAARATGLEPDVMLPSPLLLQAPGEGLVRWQASERVPDYRGVAQAFSVEDDLAALIVGDAPVRDIDESAREAGLAPVLADPPLNLRQGAFARRREWVVDRGAIRRLALLAGTLLLLSLALQLVIISRTTFAADRVEQEAIELRRALGSGGQAAQPASHAAAVAALFEAIRETPSAQLTQLAYQPGGVVVAGVTADSQATLDGLRARIEARGLQAQGGLPVSAGARFSSQLTIRRR